VTACDGKSAYRYPSVVSYGQPEILAITGGLAITGATLTVEVGRIGDEVQ
jgi:hypothetical protein